MFVVRNVRCSPRQTEALYGQRLVKSLPDGRRRAGVVALQRFGRPLKHARRTVRRIEVHASRNALPIEACSRLGVNHGERFEHEGVLRRRGRDDDRQIVLCRGVRIIARGRCVHVFDAPGLQTQGVSNRRINAGTTGTRIEQRLSHQRPGPLTPTIGQEPQAGFADMEDSVNDRRVVMELACEMGQGSTLPGEAGRYAGQQPGHELCLLVS